MIKIIYGAKGSGKTKQIIDQANAAVQSQSGDVVFIADTSRYVHDIKYQVRFTNTKESNINSEDALLGFIQGLIEANYDIRYMFIDGAARMANKSLEEMRDFYARLSTIASKTEVQFVLTVSSDFDAIPEFIRKFIEA